MKYGRPTGSSGRDFAAARDSELLAGTWLGDFKIGMLEASDKMDWCIPQVWVDVKQKRQRIGPKWPLPAAEPDVFILDELSLRRGLLHSPTAYFLLNDVPGDRWFLARVDEVAVCDRIRIDREGISGHKKGKMLFDLRQFRQLLDPESELLPLILQDCETQPWLQSHCLIPPTTES